MKRIFRMITTVVLMLAAVPSWAGDDMSATEVLDRLSENFYYFGGIKLDYNLNLNDNMQLQGSIIQKGRMAWYDNNNGTGWDDGKTLWYYSKVDNTVTESPSPDEPQDTGGDEGFGYLRVIEKMATHAEASVRDKDNTYILTVRPAKMSPYQQITKAEYVIDKNTFYPKEITIKIKAVELKYDIIGFQRGDFADSMFRFDKTKAPGAKLIKQQAAQ